jgi:8-oxo-dGTP pyrophosphatase MutT (NUDIX family)
MHIDKIKELCFSRPKLENHLVSVLTGRTPKIFKYKEVESVDAAVLIPLFFKDNQAHLLFTKRSKLVEHHKGQISFPGGKKDEEDSGLEITALRETEEEVGIAASSVKIIGQTDCLLTNTHFLVTPFAGFFSYPVEYKPNAEEIDKILEIPLTHFLDDHIFEIKSYKSDGYCWRLHYYYYQDEMIWGVTGFLMSNFLSIVFGINRNISESDTI